MPLLLKTAATSTPGSVRVTWAGSVGVDVWSPKPGGVLFDDKTGGPIWADLNTSYGMSKVANVMLSSELAKRFPFRESRLITNSWNPGNLKSELQRHTGMFTYLSLYWLLFPVVNGAHTELFAGWSEDAGKEENNAKYIWPWGSVSFLDTK